MIDPDRVLQPLRAEEGAIGRLETYGSPSELADAVAAVRDAVDRALRLLLRNDPAAPDDVRLTALSAAELPHDRLITALRRRELISLSLAGALYELEQAAARAETVDIRATDADLARRVVGALMTEVRGGPDTPLAAAAPGPLEARTIEKARVRAVARDAVEAHGREDSVHPVPGPGRGLPSKRLAIVAAVVFAMATVIFVAVRLGSRPRPVEAAIAAFRRDDFASAEMLFEGAVRADSGEVTALLYLGRIYRRDGRFSDAARVLSAAEDQAPDDADIRRELGYLFMDLERPEAAARQFDRARELAPDDELNWLGFIRALRAAGDPQAELWLERAPPGVRAALTSATPKGNG
ncbi:MAG: tetratricopeptide repeat protein [Longimicrobiales bacterium]